MKLRNKKTGEIVEYDIIEAGLKVNPVGGYIAADSLAEFCEEWEDYEEPKTFFTIYYDGTISEFRDGDDEQIRDMKAVGNYFETKEEAEKAVEKLKAWKRLKDKGFRFRGWNIADDGKGITIFANYPSGTKAYLDLLFGGEE